MKKLFWPTLFVGFYFCFEPLLAANGPDDLEKKRQDSLRAVRLEKVVAFRATYPNVAVHINKATGILAVLDGDLSSGLTKSDPVGMAYEFFEKNKEVFGMTQPQTELKVKGESKDQYGGTVRFKQVYKGVDVWNGVMYAHFTPSGRLKYVNGEFYPDIDLSAIPSIDSLSALMAARRDLKLPADSKSGSLAILGEQGKPSASLTIFPHNGQYRLAWVVRIWGGPHNTPWQYFIDAGSGAIIRKEEDVWDFEEPKKSGTGKPSGNGEMYQFSRRVFAKNDPQSPKSKPRFGRSVDKQIPVFPAESLRVRPVNPSGKQEPKETPSSDSNAVRKDKQKIPTDSLPQPIITGKGQLSPAEVRDVAKEIQQRTTMDSTQSPTWKGTGRTYTDQERARKKELMRLKALRSDSSQKSGGMKAVQEEFPSDTIRIEKKEEPKKESDDFHSSSPQSGTLTALIYRTWWTDMRDCDQDGYFSTVKLKWDPDVSQCGSFNTLEVYEEIWYKRTGDIFWIHLLSTPTHEIRGCEWDSVSILLNPFAQGFYDFRVEIYRVGQSEYDDFKDPSNDPKLGFFPAEPSGEDACPTAFIAGAWWTEEVNCDNDTYVSSARLNWDPDLTDCFAGVYDPLNQSTCEPPNPVRRPFLEIKFDTIWAATGTVAIDSLNYWKEGMVVQFVNTLARDVPVNFVGSVIAVEEPQPPCNDMTGDGSFTTVDIVQALNCVFLGIGDCGPVSTAADVVKLLKLLFSSPAPLIPPTPCN